MSSLTQRILTIAIGAPAVIGLFWVGKAINVDVIILLPICALAGMAAWEWCWLVQSEPAPAHNQTNFAVINAIMALLLGLIDLSYLFIAISIMGILLTLDSAIKIVTQGSAWKPGSSILNGIFYSSFLVVLVYQIYQLELGFELVLWFLALVWAFDVGAYVTGRLIGQTPLAPEISPNKTWEGVVGGWILALFVGVLASQLASPIAEIKLALVHTLILATLISAASQIGDLFESQLKRVAGVKDSGAILPGHGGLLDRIDGLLFAAPVFYLYLLLIT